jgi:UDP-N-acetylglucosamine 2-epimerase
MVLGFWRYRAHLHRGDYCLVHGDTLSTLFGMVMGLLCRARVVHIEAGERTHKLFRPFPEEIVRRVVDRYAALCFTSSDTAFANLAAEKLAHKSINVRHNTVLDSVRQVIDTPREIDLPERYALVSIHRVETVCSEPRMRIVCETAHLAAKTRPVIWGMHPLTKQHLMRQGLYDELADDKRIITRDLFTYVEFIKAIDGAEFIVTDGGGPQEESYLLNTPCLLMRTETEREYHHNVFRAGFDRDAIEGFLDSPERFRMKEKPVVTSPTEEILRHLLSSTSRETP